MKAIKNVIQFWQAGIIVMLIAVTAGCSATPSAAELEEIAYTKEAGRRLSSCGEYLKIAQGYMEEGGKDPSNLYDDTWKSKFNTSMALVRQECGALGEIEDVPEKYQEANDLLIFSGKEITDATYDFVNGVDRMDPDLLISANQHIENGNKYISKSLEKLKEIE